MDKQILNKLISVINALNTIEVKGKNNLANLSGCIVLLEEVCSNLNRDTVNSSKDSK